MFEKYSALGAGGRIEPSSLYPREERRVIFYGALGEEEKRVAVSRYPRAMVEYPLEEERERAPLFAASMVGYPLEEKRERAPLLAATSVFAASMVGYPLEEKRERAPLLAATSVLAASRVGYPLEEERRRVYPSGEELLGEKLILELNYNRIMSLFIDELQPSRMLDILQIRKFAEERGKEDWVREMESIEEKYFEGVPIQTEYLKQKDVERRGAISLHEARRRINDFTEGLKEFEKKFGFEISPAVVKYNIKRLLDRVDLDSSFSFETQS